MLLLLLGVLYLGDGASSECNANTGPAGTTECIAAVQYYGEYQWATCLSNEYIQLKSNHMHICGDRSRKYCYYQCMIEVHGKSYGRVSGDCSCKPNSKLWSRLPSACLSPSGRSCSWYRDCLEKKYSCKDTTNAYAIRYAESFCNMYGRKDLFLSPKGLHWTGAVRKCLQVVLVPLLRPWRSPSCQEIRYEALQSHLKCLTNPDVNITSVCDLKCFEFYKIFYAVKRSFGRRLDTAWGSFKTLWNIQDRCGLKCTRDWFKQSNTTVIKIVKVWIEIMPQQKKQSNPYDSLSETDRKNRFVDKIVEFMASSLRWNSVVLDWMAYPGSTSASLYVVLADKKALGIVQTSIPSVNFNEITAELVVAIKNSTIPVQVDGSNIWLKSLESCPDKACSQPQFLAHSKRPPVFPNSGEVLSGSVFCAIITSLIVVFW